VGQCVKSLDDWLAENVSENLDFTVLPQEDLARIDSTIFWCDNCDWCHSTEELNNDSDRNLCAECSEEEE
jgi:hypothetical protein